ncbi:Zinc finger RAD18 domain-containing protein C1orf124-like [Gryllus bimaculatus]|nr:Zinc finger RAD18 domain-containing protein C1orf124-like [Gryllus bimaculatus]
MSKKGHACLHGTATDKICCCCLNSGCLIECSKCGHKEFKKCHTASDVQKTKGSKTSNVGAKQSAAENKKKLKFESPKTAGKKGSIVDPELEFTNPNPDLQELFIEYDKKFFYGALRKHNVTVAWSKRLKVSVGNCRDDYPPIIQLSEPLLKLRPRKDTVETLLHEMIHAYLAVVPGQYEEEEHGPKFFKQMERIDRLAGTNLTVDHDFHDEVDHYSYFWECSGKCKKQIVSAVFRPPSSANVWWNDHQKNCGGKFNLIHDPKKKTGKNPEPKSEVLQDFQQNRCPYAL